MQNYSNADLMAAILDLRDATASGFERVDQRMTGLEGRMTSVEGRLNGVERRLETLEIKVDMGFADVNERLMRLEAPRRRGRGPA